MVGVAATLGVFGIIINILASLIYGKVYARYFIHSTIDINYKL